MSLPVIDTRCIRDFGRAPFLSRRNDDREIKSILNVARPSLRAGALTLFESVDKMQGDFGGVQLEKEIKT